MRPTAPILRVFISGTNTDIYDYRTAVINAVNKTGEKVVDMRDFPAQDAGAAAVSVANAAQADVVVVLIGWRYGTIGPEQTRSYTHLEYAEATRLHKPILVFLAAPDAVGLTPPDPLDPRLVALREEVSHGTHVVDTFHSQDNLAALVVAALYTYYRERFPPAPQQRIPRSLPPRVPDFVGREHDLIQIDADLRRGQHTAVAAAVAGMGGVGKSALAAEVVNQLARDTAAFAGGITWVRCNDLTGWEGVSAIYAQLLLDWGITLPPEALAAVTASQQEAEIRAQALRGRLAVADPALVLLDNVERDLPLREVLATLASLRMTVLVTTRTFFNLPQLRSHRLDVLKPEEAQRLLRERYVAKEGEWDDARDPVPAHSVVAALGHLPLAIELAAARAARLKLSIARLDRELHEPDALAKLNDPTDPTAGVQYIIGRTLDLLSPAERACFAALGQVAAVDYPQAVVLALFAALLDNAASDATAQVVDLLITLSLVTPDDVAGIMRLRLHPLLHELAAKQWQTQHDEEVQAAGRAGLLVGLNAFAREHQRDFATLSQDETLYMDALHMAEQYGVDWDAIIDLTWAIDNYLDLQGRWKLYGEILY